MNFEDFLVSISKIKNIPLPAEISQVKMMPGYRRDLLKLKMLAKKNAKQSAVLSLFYPDDNQEARLALILRKTYKGVHSAQIGFPGGKIEASDTDLKHTALRETFEEIGVKPNDISVLKKLTEVYIPPSNYIVQPFLGTTLKTPKFVLQASEVEDLLQVRLVDFLNEDSVVNKNVVTSFGKEVTVPTYQLNGYTVWGATAMMLSEIKDLLKTIL